ncbi:MAG: hypothetical protein JO166_15725 [Deltaproteobacteria bacterium]|nr:hypothetical protein [Deltaproteobacteria bacterium]
MKTLITRRKRWHGTFRSLSPADRLWVYAGTAAKQGAIWHRHHGANRPHLHVHSEVSDHHHDRAGARDHDHGSHHQEESREHHRSAHETPHHSDHHRAPASGHGHWHHIIPVADVHLAHQLLVVGLCEVWFAAPDAALVVITWRLVISARAPPTA